MHTHNLSQWSHTHQFHQEDDSGEKRTRLVIILTLVMMTVEIIAGFAFGSMALLADGWHMGTHAVALGITAFAYWYARKNKNNPRFSFGTGKVGVLGGFTSAVVLAIVAVIMAFESIERLLNPVEIKFNEAILVAVTGLVVNVISAYLLRDGHNHTHHGHTHHHDHNLKAAYLHVIADALTSILAIAALLAGKAYGWIGLDPVMGIAGAILITRWAYGLLKDTGRILLDAGHNQQKISDILEIIESDSDNRVSDLHIWKLSSRHYAAIISIVTHFPKPPDYYKGLLNGLHDLEHITIEIHLPDSESCIPL